jgi:hypothetical protein
VTETTTTTEEANGHSHHGGHAHGGERSASTVTRTTSTEGSGSHGAHAHGGESSASTVTRTTSTESSSGHGADHPDHVAGSGSSYSSVTEQVPIHQREREVLTITVAMHMEVKAHLLRLKPLQQPHHQNLVAMDIILNMQLKEQVDLRL